MRSLSLRVCRAAWAAAMLCGCAQLGAPSTPQVAGFEKSGIDKVTFAEVTGWQNDEVAESLPALQAQCRRLVLLPVDTMLGGDGLAATEAGRAGQWRPVCAAAEALAPGDAADVRRFYESWFVPYRVPSPGLFTGYYEPEVRGALTRFGAYQTPLMARPSDLVTGGVSLTDPNGQPQVGRLVDGVLLPYFTRAEIEAGKAADATRTLFWLADPVDLFFLQIQGSGRIRLPDGSVVRLVYDGKNGRPYAPIGRVLVAQGALAAGDVSMQSIRAWLESHPAERQAVMDRNEDYVFFRIDTDAAADAGPAGALGVHLSAGRSAAVDRHSVPLGVPVFIATRDPLNGKPWQHLVLAQDLGTDIKGPARSDIFFGSGAAAEAAAGKLREGGTEFLLLPRSAANS